MKTIYFKVITYKYVNTKIKEIVNYHRNSYDDKIKLQEILNDLIDIYDKSSSTHSALIYDFETILWGKYFTNMNKEGCLLDERITENYYEYSIGSLCSQFDIENKELEVWINPPIGGYVGRNRGIHFFFHTNEKDIHHTPHIHIKSGEIEFRVNLETLQVLDKKTFKSKAKTKLALQMIRLNQKELINYWNAVVINGETIKFKMYFPY